MYFSEIALEDLKNKSICVKTDKGIRNINSEIDLRINNTVYVSNLSPENEEVDIIKEGVQARFTPVNIIFK